MSGRSSTQKSSLEDDTLNKISSNLSLVTKRLNALVSNSQGLNHSFSTVRKSCDRQTTVNLRVDVYRIEDIDISKQQFTTEFDLQVTWLDEERAKSLNESSEIEEFEAGWHPEIFFPNAVRLHMIQKTFSPGNTDGMFEIIYRIHGIFKTDFNLRDFPFDYQMLCISVSSKWNRDVVLFRQDPDSPSNIISYPQVIEDEQFNVEGVVSTGVGFYENYSFHGKNTFSVCTFELPIWRRQWIFLLHYVPSVFIVTILALIVIAGSYRLPGQRILIVVVLLLAAILLKTFAHVSFLPSVHAFTLFDKYWLACAVLIFCVAVESAIVAVMTSSQKDFDVAMFVILLLAFVVVHVAFFILSLKKRRDVALRMNTIKEYYSLVARGATLPRDKTTPEAEPEPLKKPEDEESLPPEVEVIVPSTIDIVDAEPPAPPPIEPPPHVEKKSRLSRLFSQERTADGKFPPPLQAKVKPEAARPERRSLVMEMTVGLDEPTFEASGALSHPESPPRPEPTMSIPYAADVHQIPTQESFVAEPETTSTPIAANPTASITYESFNPFSTAGRKQSSDSEADPSKILDDIMNSVSEPASPGKQIQAESLYQQPKHSFRFEREAAVPDVSAPRVSAQTFPKNEEEKREEIPQDENGDGQSPRLSAFHKYNDAVPESAYVIPRYPSIALDDVTIAEQHPPASSNPYDFVPAKSEPQYSYPPSPGGPPKLASERDVSGIAKIEPIYVFSPGDRNGVDVEVKGDFSVANDDALPQEPLLPSGEPMYTTVASVRPEKTRPLQDSDNSSSQEGRVPLLSRVKDKKKDKFKSPVKQAPKGKTNDFPSSDGWL